MKKFTILLISLLAVVTFGYSQATDLIISEYIEGSSNNKAIEIYNGTGNPVDLSGYEVWRISNGGNWPEATQALSGTLADGDVYVIANSSSDAAILAVTDLTAGIATWNGDDAVGLAKDISGTMTLIDAIGEDGSDPGSGWDVAGVTNATANHTLVRKSTICSPNTDWATSAGTDATNSEWIVYNQDDFSYLGSHTGNCSGGNIPPSITNITQTPTVVTSSSTVSVSADVTDSDGTVAGVELHWGTTSGSLGNTINMSNTGGDTYTTDTDIPAQADGTTVYYEVYALDDDADDNTSPEQSYTVTDPATTTLPYSETFDADLGDCYTYSVSGDTKYWEYGYYGANGYAEMNGYNSGDTEEDWLILPGIDFDSYSNEIMTFDTWWKYGTDNATNYMKLYFSPDYPGIGDPTGYTWTEIAYTQGASDTWTSSGTLDLSGISGSSVYIAFKYHYEAGNYRHWEIDNISITPSVPVDVTFQVNMAEQTVSGNGVHVAGEFNGWDPAATQMLDADGDNVYTVTLQLNSNQGYEFKYLNGNSWGTDEAVPSSCATNNNRYEYVTAPYDSIPVVCFGSCTDCGGVHYDITFQVDMQNETVSGDGVYLAGTFTDWQNNAIQMSQSGTVWSATVSLQESSPENYKFVNGDPLNGGTWESINDRTLTVPSANTTLDLVCFNSYTACPVNDFVMINEVDADQAGADTQEFIELYDGGNGNTSLTGLVVVLYNGSNDLSYNAIDLDGYSTNGNGYFVIGSTGMSADIDMGTGWLQNGADAVALYVGSDTDFPNGTAVTTTNIVDALVYDTNDGDDPGLLVLLNPGQPQVNEAGRGNSAAHSNQRIPNGSGGLRNTDTYDQSPPTPGAVNFLVFTVWTGVVSTHWDIDGNWDNGVPNPALDATIPNVAKASSPVISGSATCASLTMAAGSSLDISPSGALTVLGTFANNGGTLTIKSDANGTGSLIESNGVNATVERFLSQDKWHYIATPTDNVNTGVYTGLYMMYWDEPAWLWKWVLSADSTLAVDMQGYALWSDGADATVSYTGALNTGSKTISLTNTPGTPNPTDYSGFNLAGNPYPSSVNWNNNDGNGWTRTNMDMTVWVWNHTAGNYGSYVKDAAAGTNGVDSILAPQQGFMVHCNNTAGGSLSVDNNARVHSAKDILKGGKSANGQFIMLKVDGNGYSDEVMISQNNNSSYNFDVNDGLKLYGNTEAPQLYTISSDNQELSINSIPALASSNLTIPMNFRAGANGEYTITLSNIEGFENTPLYLEDLYMGTITQITDGFAYNFKATTDDDENRFLIHFSDVETPPVSGEASMLTDVSIYSYDKTIYLFSKENVSGMVKVYDLTGKLVTQREINETTSGMIKDSNLKGFYIVTLTTNDGIETEKVYIK